MQPPVHPVIPTEGTLPACRSGGIYFNTLAISQNAYLAQLAKESWPVLCKTNPIWPRLKPTQPPLSQGIMKANHPWPLEENEPNRTQTNPIYPKPKMTLNLCLEKHYEKTPHPPLPPKQTQSKPISDDQSQFQTQNHLTPLASRQIAPALRASQWLSDGETMKGFHSRAGSPCYIAIPPSMQRTWPVM
jgi:hypothetical protein